MTLNACIWRARRGAVVLVGVAALTGALAAPASAAPAVATFTSVQSFGSRLLGDGTQNTRLTPGKITGLAGMLVTQVSTGARHTLALTSGGKVFAWGDNSTGALGDGTTTSSYAPVAVTIPAGVGRVVAVAAGYDASLAVTSTGQILTWGNADTLGDATTTNRLAPAAITLPRGLSGKAVSAGYHFDEIVTTNGQVWGWGTDSNGNLGTANIGTFHRPGRAKTPSTFVASSVAAGYEHTVTLGTDKTTGKSVVLAWGDNSYGQLGAGNIGSFSDTPVAVALPAGTAVTAVTAAANGSGALTAAGGVYTWGEGLPGADGTYPDRTGTPQATALPTGVHASALVVTAITVLASTTGNQLYGWGENVYGSLGPNPAPYESAPTAIALPAGTIAGIASNTTSYVILSTP